MNWQHFRCAQNLGKTIKFANGVEWVKNEIVFNFWSGPNLSCNFQYLTKEQVWCSPKKWIDITQDGRIIHIWVRNICDES